MMTKSFYMSRVYYFKHYSILYIPRICLFKIVKLLNSTCLIEIEYIIEYPLIYNMLTANCIKKTLRKLKLSLIWNLLIILLAQILDMLLFLTKSTTITQSFQHVEHVVVITQWRASVLISCQRYIRYFCGHWLYFRDRSVRALRRKKKNNNRDLINLIRKIV